MEQKESQSNNIQSFLTEAYRRLSVFDPPAKQNESEPNNPSGPVQRAEQSFGGSRALSLLRDFMEKNKEAFKMSFSVSFKSLQYINQDIIDFLKSSKNDRKNADFERIHNFFEEIQFFKNLSDEQGQEAAINCYKVMMYEQFKSEEVICYHGKINVNNTLGEIGRKFYIILQGDVGVKVPTTVEFTLTKPELLETLAELYNDIIWNDPENEKIKPYKEEVDKLFKGSNSDAGALQQPTQEQVYKIRLYKEVVVLGKGKSFGELALMSNKPRAATCYAKTKETHLAVLDKLNYKRVLGQIIERRMNKKIEFLQRFYILHNLVRQTLQKLSYYLEERSYIKNQIVVKQGQPMDGVYFIIDGEFQLSCKVTWEVPQTGRKGVNGTKVNLGEIKQEEIQKHFQGISSTVRKNDFQSHCLNTNELFGLIDIYNHNFACHYTIKVVSQTAKVFFISRQEFLWRVQNRGSEKFIQKIVMQQKSFHEQQIHQFIQVKLQQETLNQNSKKGLLHLTNNTNPQSKSRDTSPKNKFDKEISKIQKFFQIDIAKVTTTKSTSNSPQKSPTGAKQIETESDKDSNIRIDKTQAFNRARLKSSQSGVIDAPQTIDYSNEQLSKLAYKAAISQSKKELPKPTPPPVDTTIPPPSTSCILHTTTPSDSKITLRQNCSKKKFPTKIRMKTKRNTPTPKHQQQQRPSPKPATPTNPQLQKSYQTFIANSDINMNDLRVKRLLNKLKNQEQGLPSVRTSTPRDITLIGQTPTLTITTPPRTTRNSKNQVQKMSFKHLQYHTTRNGSIKNRFKTERAKVLQMHQKERNSSNNAAAKAQIFPFQQQRPSQDMSSANTSSYIPNLSGVSTLNGKFTSCGSQIMGMEVRQLSPTKGVILQKRIVRMRDAHVSNQDSLEEQHQHFNVLGPKQTTLL